MTAPDLISALTSATPHEAREIADLIALTFSAHATPHAVELMRKTLQIGDRFTSNRVSLKQGIGVPIGGDSVGAAK